MSRAKIRTERVRKRHNDKPLQYMTLRTPPKGQLIRVYPDGRITKIRRAAHQEIKSKEQYYCVALKVVVPSARSQKELKNTCILRVPRSGKIVRILPNGKIVQKIKEVGKAPATRSNSHLADTQELALDDKRRLDSGTMEMRNPSSQRSKTMGFLKTGALLLLRRKLIPKDTPVVNINLSLVNIDYHTK